MRKWLIFIGVVALLVVGTGFWLAGKAADGRPEAGEVRQEIENVF